MSEAAFGRIGARLADHAESLDPVLLCADGVLRRGGAPAERVDPEVVWASLDLYASGQLPAMFGQIFASEALKWVQVFAAGLDNPAFTAVMAKGARLTKSSAQAPAIAEYVLAHALSLIHPMEAFRRAQDAREWRFQTFREVAETRWLLVGFGSIGVEIARRLQPFGARLSVVRRSPSPDPLAAEVRPMEDLPRLLPESDVVVLACALNADTRGLADDAFFQALKPGALLINIGRGGLLDEEALRSGLDRDQPGRAVLDVFQTEPLPGESWLWGHPKVQVTSHCSGGGEGVLARGDRLFLENLARYQRGAPLLNEARRSEVGLAD
jgi:phosphoglycerate dehydrogenase-like enzyme